MEKITQSQRRRIVLAAGASAVAGATALVWKLRGGNASYPEGPELSLELGSLAQGKLLTVDWRGLPVWVLRRSQEQVAALSGHEEQLADPNSDLSQQPPSCRNSIRSQRAEFLVAIGLCTHQGCTPALVSGGFLCPCHASKYDLAGRVFKAGPATANLVIPAHQFLSGNTLVLGS